MSHPDAYPLNEEQLREALRRPPFAKVGMQVHPCTRCNDPAALSPAWIMRLVTPHSMPAPVPSPSPRRPSVALETNPRRMGRSSLVMAMLVAAAAAGELPPR